MADRLTALARTERSATGRVRIPRGADLAAVVVGVAALVAACASGSSGAPSTSGSTTVVAAVTSPATTAPPTAATTVATTAAPATTATTDPPAPTTAAAPAPDAAAALQQGLAALGTSYHFATTATVDGATVLTADGDHVGDGQRFAVTSNGATVQYVITPDGTWVQQAGQDWQQVDDPPSTSDPIGALGAPTSVVVAGVDGTTITLTVTVPATALGLTDDGDVPLTAVVTDGVLTSVRYETAAGSRPAAVQATFSSPADASPVTAPA